MESMGTSHIELWLLGGFVATFAVWLGLSAFVIADRLRYEQRRRAPGAIASEMSDVSAAAYAAYSLERFGLARILHDASSHRRRDKWRRIAALFSLGHLRWSGVHDLLERAVADGDAEVAGAAVVVLQQLGDRRAAEILVAALRAQSPPPSRIATQLDQFPIPIDDVLRPLLSDPLPHARYWAVSLLRRYVDARDLAPAVARLVDDEHGPVRKVAIETLAEIDPRGAASVIVRRLDDPVDFVRSMAVRALSRLAAASPDLEVRRACARTIMPLLADATWEVRLAAKESLVALGLAVWPDVAAGLESPDRFARNTSAEILQNLGMIDAAIEELLRGVTPSPDVMRVLERVLAEGGPVMVDAAVGRSKPGLAPSVAALLGRLKAAA